METKIDVRALGGQIAAADRAVGAAYMLLAEAFKGADYAAWERIRVEFIEGASKTHAAPADLWERTIRAMRTLGLVGDKPKAEGKSAAKSVARATVKDEAEKALKEGKTTAELLSESAALIEAGKMADAGRVNSVALKMAEIVKTDGKARQNETLKAARERFDAAMKAAREAKALDCATLEKLTKLIEAATAKAKKAEKAPL
jgi:hypothetical protein